jgi:putative FmdB family regulatory protein
MPTYEYVCKNCGENLEVFQSFSDKPLKKHKVCGGDLQKVFHARGIVFKGSGFYATDRRKAAKGTDPKKDSSSKKSPKETAKASTSSSDD